MSVELPPHLLDFVETKVGEGQFESVSAYLVALVEAVYENRNEIESALIEGLRSGPAEEWKSEEWQAIRERVKNWHMELGA